MAEAERRCVTFIAAYDRTCDEISPTPKKQMYRWYGKGLQYDSMRLAAVLENDIINDWNGEMQTLMDIHINGFDGLI